MRVEQALFAANRCEIEDDIFRAPLTINVKLFELVGYADRLYNGDDCQEPYVDELIQTCVDAEWLREKLYLIGTPVAQRQQIASIREQRS